MKKKNFYDLTDKQREEEIAKLGTVILSVIPEDTNAGHAIASLISVLAYYIINEAENPLETLKKVVKSISEIVNKMHRLYGKDKTND